MKVSVIIPVYNEFRKLPEVLDRVIHAPLPEGCEKEIVIVDDGSTDGTTRLLEQYTRPDMIVVHRSVLNFGKGTAVRIGLAIATGDIVLIQDGDLEYDPQDYPRILEPLVRGDETVTYGSRFLGRMRGMKWANWVANQILTFTANLLYGAGITDEATAYKAFRSDVLKSVRLECRRFEFCPEVTAKMRRMGHHIHEVPISYNARGIAEGKKIRWQDGVHALWTLVRWRFAARRTFVVVSQPPRRASGRRKVLKLVLPVAGATLFVAYVRLLGRGAKPARETPELPRVLRLSPAATLAGQPFHQLPSGESALIVYGAYFQTSSHVFFGERPLQTVYGDATYLTAKVPGDLYNKPGKSWITVAGPTGRISNRVEFTVVAPGSIVPVIQQLFPSQSTVGSAFNLQPNGTSAIAVQGYGFLPGATVQFDGVPLSTTFSDSSHLSALVPKELLTKAHTVAVRVENPDSQQSVAVPFVVQAAP